MPKYKVIPGYVDESGKHFVMNVLTTLFEPYNPSKQKMAYSVGLKVEEGPKIYKFYYKSGDNKLLFCFPSTPDSVRMTVCKQEDQKVYGRLPNGEAKVLNYNQVATAVEKGKINNLKIFNGMICVDEDPKSSNFKLNVPDYLKDVVDDDWNLLSKSEDSPIKNSENNSEATEEPVKIAECGVAENVESIGDKVEVQSTNSEPAPTENYEQSKASAESSADNSSSCVNFENLVKIRLEQDLAQEEEKASKKEKEAVVDLKFKVDSENKNDKLPEMTYLDFYKEMINNSRVGDILSIPRCLLDDLRVEFIKILEGSFSSKHQTVISKVKTGNSVSNISISIIGMQDDSEYCTMQIMSKPLDENSVSVQDIDVEFYKWKQSRKYIQG